MNIIQKYIPIHTLRRSGQKMLGAAFIVAHDTGNDKTTALMNASYFANSANEVEASAHAFIDDKGAIECMPLDEKAYHVRRAVTTDNELFNMDAIDWAFGIELCFFSDDIPRSKLAYANYVTYIANLCKKYKLDPHTHIVGHYTLDPTRRTDPLNAFKFIGVTWDEFLDDVDDVLLDRKDVLPVKTVEAQVVVTPELKKKVCAE